MPGLASISALAFCALGGTYFARRKARRAALLDRLERYLDMLGVKTGTLGLPLAEAIAQTQAEGELGEFFSAVEAALRRGGASLEQIWNAAIDERRQGLSALNDGDIELLRAAGELLSSLTIHDQRERMGKIAEKLAERRREAEDEQRKTGALYRKLGVLAGLALAAALW